MQSMMVMVAEVECFRRSQVSFYHLLVASGMVHHSAAFADALIRLNVRTRRYLLQFYLHRLAALLALECEETGWFIAHIAIEYRKESVALSCTPLQSAWRIMLSLHLYQRTARRHNDVTSAPRAACKGSAALLARG
jgi:hypothetical protein